MAIQHLPPTASPDDVTAAIGEDGGVIVDRLVGAEVIDAVMTELEPHHAANTTGFDDFTGRNTRRTGGLVARSPTGRGLITHPLAVGVASRMLAHATSIQLHLTQLISIGPGEPAQLIHRDQWAFDTFPFPTGYEVQSNTLWAMTDFTDENGATRLVPGSHRLDGMRQFAVADTEAAEMEKGSVLFYSGALYHGGGANRSSEVRSGLSIMYNVSWLRQEENQYLTVPHDVAKTLDIDLLRLIGFAPGAYALGYLDDMRDPLAAVRPDLAKTGSAIRPYRPPSPE